jgi:hypothetical protein
MRASARSVSQADLSFLIASVYALVLTCDIELGDFSLVAHEGNHRQ